MSTSCPILPLAVRLLQLCHIGIIVLDECHHCHSDHPYAQLFQDFYWTAKPADRPHVLGLTATPERMEEFKKNKAGRDPGLMATLDCKLAMAANR